MAKLSSTFQCGMIPEWSVDPIVDKRAYSFGPLMHQHLDDLGKDNSWYDSPRFTDGEKPGVTVHFRCSLKHEDSRECPGVHSYHHRRESWELRRDEIGSLYIENRKTLDTVIRTMASRGFSATKKQYKRRIQEWGFGKNIRRQDAAQMLTLRRKRIEEGKDTDFEINGRPVDLDEYIKRSRAFRHGPTQPISSETTELPEHVRPRTPPFSIAGLRSPGDIIRVQELVHAYCKSLPSSESSLLPRPGHPYVSHIGKTVQVFEQLFRASWLFDEKHHYEAGAITRDAFLRIETLHRASFPQFLLFTLYGSIIYPVKTDILLQLWKYLAARCESVEKDTAGSQLATSVYQLLHAGNSEPGLYFKIIPELVERVLDMNIDKKANGHNEAISMDPGFLQWLMKPKMNMDIGRTAETKYLIQRCIERSIFYIKDPSLRQVFEAYASALGLDPYGQWRPPSYQSRNVDGGQIPKLPLGEWMYYSSLARVEKRRCRDQISIGNPRHDLACYYLERSITLWLHEAAPQPHVIMDLRILEEWCREGGDFLRADAARVCCNKEIARLMAPNKHTDL
ncbi:putative Clr5 domain-containing protein [Seiridium unicorne]|uniref:Clr5 domain-containing protein n=1 Tax=Seiridium unicorne TaxID=138068 RepID=A0ABR2UIC9_9PEZI